jgi:RNA polymerase sigma-70 factor (ECF subfamily)
MQYKTSREDLGSPHVGTAERGGGGDSAMMRQAIARAQDGCPQALRFLYIYYAPEVLHYVRTLIRDHYEAEDIAQEVFVKLISVIGKYEGRGVPFGAWIRRVARNVAMDHLRTRRSIPCEEIRVRDDERLRISRERARDLRMA